ncbi:MAG: GNAT family N-acetyltransferase, partial [Acidimicrobiales bacterium]|nr:GNAT family N-acetyltransferase [Acidimicrobiales bacterium]
MAVEIRTLDPDDLDQLADLGAHSFGGPRPEMVLEQRPIPPEEAVAAYDGDRLVGHVAAHRFRQWFGGRAVPCGGVAGVMVMPDQRGSGLAARMMAAMTEA